MSLLEELLTIGFLTGSRAFGTARENSDYDIVYSIQDSDRINERLGSLEKTPSDYFAGYYVKDGDKIINLIPVHPHEFLPWYLTTKAVKSTLAFSGIVDPINKYAIFSGMVALFKATVEKLGTLENYDSIRDHILEAECVKS